MLHLSCHGLNNWPDPTRPGGPGVPVLLMEDEVGDGRPTSAADLGTAAHHPAAAGAAGPPTATPNAAAASQPT